jgi:hypothetical protein
MLEKHRFWSFLQATIFFSSENFHVHADKRKWLCTWKFIYTVQKNIYIVYKFIYVVYKFIYVVYKFTGIRTVIFRYLSKQEKVPIIQTRNLIKLSINKQLYHEV